MGSQIYAVPLAMMAIPGNYTSDLFRRVLELHRFDGLSSPSRRNLPFANFTIVAGPDQVSPDFINRVMNRQGSLDHQAIVVNQDNDPSFEFYLQARNPK